jgi:hypothetical protein
MTQSITQNQLNDMATAACDSYEFNCSWRECARVAYQFARDELNVKPRQSAVFAAVNLAKLIWEGRVASSRNKKVS